MRSKIRSGFCSKFLNLFSKVPVSARVCLLLFFCLVLFWKTNWKFSYFIFYILPTQLLISDMLCLHSIANNFWMIFQFSSEPYKHTTCIPRWNDVETTVPTSFQHGIHGVCLQGHWVYGQKSCLISITLIYLHF